MKTIAQIAMALLIYCVAQEIEWFRHDYEVVHHLPNIAINHNDHQ